ncbi:MAG TPA: replication-relaxation family protein [Thermoleophilaceae bacterium]
MTVAASYVEAHRYDGAAIEHSERERIVACAVQPRDMAIVRDVWRHKFLTAPQLRELWWPGRSVQAADRRLLALFRAALLERFRPIARRGSFPWTYHLGREGHRLLQRSGIVATGARFAPRAVYDYGHVLHELQLNAWVLAYRRAVGDALVSWEGETHIEPPRAARRAQLRLEDDWSVEGLRDARARPLRPDAVLEIARDAREVQTFLIEYDRTRRVDKNFEKFRRYDAYLTWWWRHTVSIDHGGPPFVLFVCQDEGQRERFLATADEELTGHRWHPSAPPDRHEHAGRRRILFAVEQDAHAGVLEAWRLPPFPSGHPARHGEVRRVRIGRSVSDYGGDSNCARGAPQHAAALGA